VGKRLQSTIKVTRLTKKEADKLLKKLAEKEKNEVKHEDNR